MQSVVAIGSLGKKLCCIQVFLGVSYHGEYVEIKVSLLYEVPGGNLVGGLPPAASNGGVGLWVASWTKTMCGKSGLQP